MPNPGSVSTPSPSGSEFITALGETFVASPRATYITGTTVAADGGRRAIKREPR